MDADPPPPQASQPPALLSARRDDTSYITAAQPTLFAGELDVARAYAEAARSAATRRAYASDWRIFLEWCRMRAIEPLPADPTTVAVFLAHEADRGSAPMTVGRRLAAIGYHHRQAGLQPPQEREGAAAIREVLAGIRRSHGVAPQRKRPTDADMLRDLLRAVEGDGLRAVRDRALLALGMAGAFRRSELVALEVADLAWDRQGVRVTVRRGKTDQEGAGAVVAILEGRRIRPTTLLRAWLDAAGIADGPVFRRLTRNDKLLAPPMSDRAVARLVQATAAAAGYRPTDYAGHSLRSGFLTEAARQGASVFKMREVSRHKSMQVLADYVRDAELFDGHAGERFL